MYAHSETLVVVVEEKKRGDEVDTINHLGGGWCR